MAWWNKLGSKILDFLVPSRRLPDSTPRRGRKAKREPVPRTLPVSRETPAKVSRETAYAKQLRELRELQQAKRELEEIMFDESKSLETRREALDKYNLLTGYWRPENNNEWSSEEWKRWEEIYESEPEVF